MDALASDVQRQAAVLQIVFGDGGARFEEVGDRARVHDLDSDDASRPGECDFGLRPVTDLVVVGEVARRAGINLRSAFLDRRLHFDDRRTGLPIDGHGLGGVARLPGRVRNDHRDDIPDMLHDVVGHHRIRLQRRQRSIRVLNRGEAGQPAQRCEVARDENAVYPREGARSADVRHCELGASVRAAQEDRVQSALWRVIRGEGALPFHQANVLDAFDWLADAELHCSHASFHRRVLSPDPLERERLATYPFQALAVEELQLPLPPCGRRPSDSVCGPKGSARISNQSARTPAWNPNRARAALSGR